MFVASPRSRTSLPTSVSRLDEGGTVVGSIWDMLLCRRHFDEPGPGLREPLVAAGKAGNVKVRFPCVKSILRRFHHIINQFVAGNGEIPDADPSDVSRMMNWANLYG